MSTEEFNIDENLLKQLGALGKDLPNKEQKANDAIAGQRSHQDNLLTGASVLIQRSEDEIAREEEKLAQYRQIRTIKAGLKQALKDALTDSDSSDEEPAPSSDDSNGNAPEPQAPARPASPIFAVEPVRATPPAEPPVTQTVAVPRYSGRPHTFAEWALALVGLVVGAIIGWLIFWAVVSNTHHEPWKVIFVIIFGIAALCIAAAGFFGGGLLGWRLDHRNRSAQQPAAA